MQEEKGLLLRIDRKGVESFRRPETASGACKGALCDSDVYIFDEATSNVDAESEDAIIAQIYELSETKTVLMISHRLANVTKAGRIYVLGQGRIVQSGTHESLLTEGSVYQKLWNAQQELEQYGKEVRRHEKEIECCSLPETDCSGASADRLYAGGDSDGTCRTPCGDVSDYFGWICHFGCGRLVCGESA